MIRVVLILFFVFVTNAAPAKDETRGFYPVLVSNSSRSENRSERYQEPEYFALTSDGRLEKVQLVLPQGVKLQQKVEEAKPFVLTPDGRLEKLEEFPKSEVEDAKQETQFFKLTEDGRFERISEQDLPEEDNGEYHVILPDGTLQRVRFMTLAEANRLTAKVSYQQVEPITGPVYKYAAPLSRVV